MRNRLATAAGPSGGTLLDDEGALARQPWYRSVELLLAPALVVLIIVGALVNPRFLSYTNISNILVASAALGILVVAETIIILTGSIDLSLESTVAISPALTGLLVLGIADGGWGLHWPVWLAIVAGLLAGPLIGLVNGVLIIKLGLDGFIVTIAMLIVVRGVQTGLSNSRTLQDLPSEMHALGSTEILSVPLSVWITGFAFLAGIILLRYHTVGRSIYATGGNLNAARLSGIRVDRLRIGAFVIGGFLAAIAGFVLVGYVGSIPPNLGKDYLFSVFAATVVGGVSLNGGKGSLIGALMGVLILGVVQNLMVLAQVPTYWIKAVYGVIILLALVSARASAGTRQGE